MTLDVLTVPPMSDEPERTFSATGNVVALRRRRLKDEALQSVLTLKSWSRQKLVKVDRTLFKYCATSMEPAAAPIHSDTATGSSAAVSEANNTSTNDAEHPIPLTP
ncbi:hypothetical protein LTR85_002290 [Meristemomyces frigidus]|nr:hypothetical protein LTR85_002290 [Meristemomyces frigidus]